MLKVLFAILILGYVLALILLKSKRGELLLLAFSIIATTSIVELYLKVFDPQIMQHDGLFIKDEKLGWRFKKNAVGNIVYKDVDNHMVSTNSWGFRDSEPNLMKTHRILVTGDSFVSNLAVNDNEVFTEVMQRTLTDAEVFNIGVSGYGQVQELLNIREVWDTLTPDLVILVVYLRNDFTDNVRDDWQHNRPIATLDQSDTTISILGPSKNNRRFSTYSFARRNSHLAALALRKIDNIKINHFDKVKPALYGPPESFLCRNDLSSESEHMYLIMEKLLLEINGFVEGKGSDLLVVLAPSIVQIEDDLWNLMVNESGGNYDDYLRTQPGDKLVAFCKKNDMNVVDLFPIIYEQNKVKKLYNPFEHHWNKSGNELVAKILSEHLIMNHSDFSSIQN